MKSFVSIFLLLGAIAGISLASPPDNYDGYKVMRIFPYTNPVVERLQILSSMPGFEYWLPLRGLGHPVDILIAPYLYRTILREMEYLDAPTYVLISDVQKEIDNQREANKEAKSKVNKDSKAIDHSYYRDLDEYYQELDDLEANFPTLFSSENIGVTYEGRDVRLEKVSAGGLNKPIVWIDCGIHAREWVSHASCLYFLDQLSGYGTDSDVTSLLDTYDFYILPIVNPDGYVYTWDSIRLWRKNRRPFVSCVGVDLNRNFDSDFGGPGTSSDPCDSTYHGPSAFSELETQAIRDTIDSLGSRVKGFYTIHSYSQLWMTNYGYTHDLPADYDEQYRVAEIGVEALTAVEGTEYQYGNIADVIYEAAGGSTDWVYDSQDIVYAYALELRDQGQYGFLLPADQIEPTGRETWEGIKASIFAFQ